MIRLGRRTYPTDEEAMASVYSETDEKRAEYAGRRDYWNSTWWRRERACEKADAAFEKWHAEHTRLESERFFSLLRERLPELFAARSISITLIKKQEQAIKEVMLSVGCNPRWLRLLDWPVRISPAAHREFEIWALRMRDEYEGPDTLVSYVSPLSEEEKALFEKRDAQ